MQTMYTSSCPA